MEPPPLSGRRFRFTIRTSFYNRPAIPRRKSERIPTRGPIAGRREYVVVLSSVGLRPAENASTACGGTMQPSAWSGCGLPLSGRSRRANLLQSLVLAESECESVGNILNVYPKASRTSDWAFPARSGFTTFCHRKGPQGTSVGIGRRFSLSGHKRLRCFARPLRALEPPSDLIPPPVQCGICGALRATMIICWSPVLTGLRPAGSHCESSG